MKKKNCMAEEEALQGLNAFTAHSDEVATVTWEEVGLELSDVGYRTALKRIESLMDVAKLGTTEGEELERLIKLVEAYEEEHFPM